MDGTRLFDSMMKFSQSVDFWYVHMQCNVFAELYTPTFIRI